MVIAVIRNKVDRSVSNLDQPAGCNTMQSGNYGNFLINEASGVVYHNYHQSMKNSPFRKSRITRSKLDSFRKLILTKWRAGESQLTILEELRAKGCPIKRERLRTWIREQVALGRFPMRAATAGRPPKKAQNQRSLGFLSHDPSAPVDIPIMLRILFIGKGSSGLDIDPTKEECARIGIPLDENGEMDLVAYAKSAGVERILSLGDMDLIFIASFLEPWSRHPDRWSESWLQGVFRTAAALRVTLLEAAESP